MIIRDSQENFIAGLSKKLNAHLGAIEAKAKAKAFEDGFVFASEVGIQNVVVCIFVSCSSRMIAATYESECVNFSHLLAKNVLGIDDYVA